MIDLNKKEIRQDNTQDSTQTTQLTTVYMILISQNQNGVNNEFFNKNSNIYSYLIYSDFVEFKNDVIGCWDGQTEKSGLFITSKKLTQGDINALFLFTKQEAIICNYELKINKSRVNDFYSYQNAVKTALFLDKNIKVVSDTNENHTHLLSQFKNNSLKFSIKDVSNCLFFNELPK